MQLEPTVDESGPAEFRAALAACLERRGLQYGTADDGTLVVGVVAGDESTPFQVLYNAGGWAGPGVGALVRAVRPIPRPQWAAVLAACNAWNGRARLLKARLDADDWEHAAVAQVALDAWMPVGPDPDLSAIDAFVEGTLRVAGRFWSTTTDAESAD